LELDAVKQAIAGAEPEAKHERAMTMGQKFAAKAGDFDAGNRASRMRMQMKAGEITNSVGSKPLGGVTNLGMRSPVDLPLVIRDLLTTIEIQTDSVEFSFIDTFTNNAGMVAELAKKPQSELTFDMETLPTRVVAHFIKASKQALSDNTFLQGLIDNRLRRGLDAKIEQQLLLGDGLTQNLRGLLPNATAFSNTQLSTVATPNRLDVIRLAMLQTVLSGYASNGIVLNPLDAFTIGLTKDDVGGYLISNPLATTGNMTLWGLPVIESTSMTADNFLVGDFKQAELYNRWDTTVEAGYENDDFTKNMVTLLCESRLALGIVDKLALVKGDFTTALA
ncbi:MAG TPA: phage major capsid protein, partial [Pseudomonas sp.]|nr:phage major capsid protein [Pseudomonas sp.]